MNLFDIMRNAGGGDAFSAMAAQFGLSEAQISKAVEAFMPAFSAGLKRSTADPLAMMEFIRRLSGADYARAYEQPGWSFAGGRGPGEDALAFLFGSSDIQRALAAQASALTGIAQEKLAALMPAIAAMMFGGIAQQSSAVNPVLAAWLKQAQAMAPEPAKPAKGPLDRYEDEQAGKGEPLGALGRAQGEMLAAGLNAFHQSSAALQQNLGEAMKAFGGGALAGGATRPDAEASGRDVFGELFDPGRRLGEAYQREMESILDRLRPATSRS